MGEIKKDCCDQCGKEVADHYMEEGWIQLRCDGIGQSGSISISICREEGGTARTGYCSFRRLDFCGAACLTKYLEGLVRDALDTLEKHGYEIVEVDV